MAGERDKDDHAGSPQHLWDKAAFAQKLETLFAEVPYRKDPTDDQGQHLDGRGRPIRAKTRYSSEDLANAVVKATGRPCSRQYIDKLRSGTAGLEPTQRQVKAIAAFFDTTDDYFFDDGKSAEITQQIELLATLRAAGFLDNPDTIVTQVTLLTRLRDAGLLEFLPALLAHDGRQLAARALLDLDDDDVPLVAAMIDKVNALRRTGGGRPADSG